jgi:hypothetical protein
MGHFHELTLSERWTSDSGESEGVPTPWAHFRFDHVDPTRRGLVPT